MSNRQHTRAQPFRIVTRRTRDVQIPLYEGGEDLACYGWRCIPLPPGDPLFENWEILDSSHDYKTTWMRRAKDYVIEAKLGGGGRQQRGKRGWLRAVAWLKPR